MKAIIMAGGEGTRLRPLTCDCPKPMLPLLDRPLMEYAIRLLKRHGIDEIAATLGYLPDHISRHFGDGASLGVKLRYYIENSPLGTAGSVKQAQAFLDTPFIVLSGDGISDIDLSAALRFHQQRGALATLILKQHPHPEEYGMVVTDAQGRVTSFHEKPGRCDVYSDKINTGIYILQPEVLEHIPSDRRFDFGHDLFPALLAGAYPIYGYTANGYWCDVGDVAAYLRVHADALSGHIHLPDLPPPVSDASPNIEAPVYIAPDACIHPDARIRAYSVISSGCHVDANADIKRSILMPDARVARGARLRGCVTGRNSRIDENAQLFEQSVVGAHSRVGRMATLAPGVKLWPEKQLPDGEQPQESVIWGELRKSRFRAGALSLENPAQASRAAQGCVTELGAKEILLGRAPSTVATAMGHAVSAGIMAQGVQLLDCGTYSLPILRHAIALLHCDGAIYVDADQITPLNALGARLEEKTQRGILKRIERQDFPAPFRGITLSARSTSGLELSYIAALASAFSADPSLAPVIALHAQAASAPIAEAVLQRAHLRYRMVDPARDLCPTEEEIGVCLSPSGESAQLSDSLGTLSDAQHQLAHAWTAKEMGENRLILPVNATRAIEQLGANAIYVPGENSAWMNTLAKASPLQFRLHHDGLYFALCFLSRLTEHALSLRQWLAQCPNAHRVTRPVLLPERERGRILRALAQNDKQAELGGGVRLKRDGGWTWLGADEDGARLNIITEAADMETARELCDFYSAEIQRLLRESGD